MMQGIAQRVDAWLPAWMTAGLYLLFAAVPASIAFSTLAHAMLLVGVLAARPWRMEGWAGPRWVALPFLALLLVAVVSALAGEGRLHRLVLIGHDYRIFIVPWMVMVALSSANPQRLFKVMAVMTVAAGVMGIAQYYLGFAMPTVDGVAQIDDVGGRFRAEGFFNNPMTYSGVLLILAAVFVSLGLGSCAPGRWWWLTAAVFAVLGVLVSLSRSGLLGLVVGLVVIGLRFSRKWVLVALVVLTVPPVLYWSGVVPIPAMELPVVVRRMNLSDMVHSVRGRLYLWEAAWRGYRDHPWLGVGMNAQTDPMLAYQRVVSAEHGNYDYAGSWGAPAHNVYLEILLELGTFGLIAYLGMWAVVFTWIGLTLQRAPPQAAWQRDLLWGIAAGLAGSMTAGLLEDNIFDGEVQTAITLMFGIAFFICRDWGAQHPGPSSSVRPESDG